MGMIEECTKKEDDKADLESKLEVAVRNIIDSTTSELMGEPYQMERKLYEVTGKGGSTLRSIM